MHRQGDVFIVPISAIPKSTEPVGREGGRAVLAHGEATGHAHAIKDRHAALFRDPKLNTLFLHMDGEYAGPIRGAIVEEDDDWFLAQTDLRVMPVKFAKRHARRAGGQIECGPFGLLEHDEHNPQAIPNGEYEVIRQREYSPEAIRNVAD